MNDGLEAWLTPSGLYYCRREPSYEEWDTVAYYSLAKERIQLAKATCPGCGDTIESKMCGDWVSCSCKKSFVDTDRWMPERHRFGGLVAKV